MSIRVDGKEVRLVNVFVVNELVKVSKKLKSALAALRRFSFTDPCVRIHSRAGLHQPGNEGKAILNRLFRLFKWN